MKLIIDIGNTRVKAALFKKKELEHSFIFDSVDQLLSAELFYKYSITETILGSVVNNIELFTEQLKQQTKVLVFSSETPTSLKNCYTSAHTLGSDRFAAAVGANALFPNQNLLVIDAGTCIKYNFINASNEYMGGGISPGLQMRFKALNTFTSRLPLLEVDLNFDKLVGTNSKESILSGVELGTLAEVDGMSELYKHHYENLKIVLTGGDTDFFEKRLKNRIFADQFLILKGLNDILDFNRNK